MRSELLPFLCRLLTLRTVEKLDVFATDRVVAILGAVALAVWAAIDRLGAADDASFEIYGIPDLGLPILALLLLAFLIARRSRPQLLYRQGLLLLLTVLSPLLIAAALIERFLSGNIAAAAQILLLLYAVLYLGHALKCFTGAAQPRALLLGLCLLLGYGWLANATSIDPSLWRAPEAGDGADGTTSPAIAEPLLFDQQARLDDALDKIAPSGDAAGPAVFFVGFAGVGEQKVFAQEIKLAARVIAQRYGSAARQLLLINDRRDLDAYPLASVSGLEYALQGLAERMNLERDILFLALSSHGSADPALSVSNGSLPLEQVTGENLATALADSGIKWRIIVISACYAGAFIDALKNDHTIIIAAADSDRTSFGCSDDRELTYFGEAFYRDSLPRADSLRQAFGLASQEISTRESQERVTPSRPQAFFGSEIEPVLTKLESARRDGNSRAYRTHSAAAH
jgi:hypothetical protein